MDAPGATEPAEAVDDIRGSSEAWRADDDRDSPTQREDDDIKGADEDDNEDEDDDDEEPQLKYAYLTKHLGSVYRNGDATSAFLSAGDKMVCYPRAFRTTQTEYLLDYWDTQWECCKWFKSRAGSVLLTLYSMSSPCLYCNPFAFIMPILPVSRLSRCRPFLPTCHLPKQLPRIRAPKIKGSLRGLRLVLPVYVGRTHHFPQPPLIQSILRRHRLMETCALPRWWIPKMSSCEISVAQFKRLRCPPSTKATGLSYQAGERAT